MIWRIIIGAVICVIGFYMVKKPEMALDFIGPIDFAERNVSSGSQSFYKLIGIIVIAVGFMVITNLYGDVIMWFAKFFVGGKK
ncbi:hypothetical protein HZB94_00210 [Candidatus Falkowbacteria bacterium]|nr:hypothetical protein [Candidatus Falkowbacteria bacterium]